MNGWAIGPTKTTWSDATPTAQSYPNLWGDFVAPLKNGLLRCLGRGEHFGDAERRTVIEDQIREGAPRIHAEEAGWGIRACAIMI